MKNWKTTSSGILLIIGAVVGVVFAPVITSVVIMAAATSAITGLGLLFAKDFNVTGGTTPATPEAKSRIEPEE